MRNIIIAILLGLLLLGGSVNRALEPAPGGCCHAMPVGDFNGDGAVDFDDFALFAAHYPSVQGDAMYRVAYDLNCDGKIGDVDFGIFQAVYPQ